MLKLSAANKKIRKLVRCPDLHQYVGYDKNVYSLDLLADVACPGADKCRSKSVFNVDTGKYGIKDGPNCEYRCFSAMAEVVFPTTRILREHNFNTLKSTKGWRNIYNLIVSSLPSDLGILRYHVGGDWFKANYLKAAIQVARDYPKVLFYSYTKSLHFIEKYFPMQDPQNGVMLPNFLVTASRGGKFDHLIKPLKIREARVFGETWEARQLGLEIDTNDSHAATPGGGFRSYGAWRTT